MNKLFAKKKYVKKKQNIMTTICKIDRNRRRRKIYKYFLIVYDKFKNNLSLKI